MTADRQSRPTLDALVLLYAATSFVTAALLFGMEPMVVKGLLPVLGGGAAVWTTAVAFFQLALLAGYFYAHAVPAWMSVRRHALLHVALLAAAVALLAPRPPTGWVAPSDHTALWLFARLATTVGPLFVLLAATAPLVQRWLASTAHRSARDPYFLYAASNAGSLVALAAYPIAIEPLFGLTDQRRFWSAGAIVAVALLVACAVALRGASATSEPALGTDPTPASAGPTAAPSAAVRVRWLLLAAVPSSLLLSVTSYVTTDVIALPLLWVVPLALYLITFIVAFARRTRLRPRWMLRLQAVVLLPLVAEMFLRTDAAAWTLVPLHLFALFVTALVCHQTLASMRPPAAHATDFYLTLAAGGALGGLFNTFAAPVLFRGLYEYPICLVAAALLRPRATPGAAIEDATAEHRARRLDVGLPLAIAALLSLGVVAERAVEDRFGLYPGLAVLIALVSVAGAAAIRFQARPLRFGLTLAAILVAGAGYARGSERLVYAARSFYGAHRVVLEPPTRLTLSHGNTKHGAQDLDPARRRDPLAYYHRGGPIGAVMAGWQGRPQRRRVVAVGLGTGAIAAYAAPGERWTFFEIDPEIVDIARDRGLFSYLTEAATPIEVALGDGRLSLAALPDASVGILVLDAFSSDAVPAHLLTREAVALDVRKLAAGGVIALHLSNRYLDLEPVVAGTVAELGLAALVRLDVPSESELRAGKQPSRWMVVARDPSDLSPLAADPRWVRPARVADGWTDDMSNLWRCLRLRGT